MNQPLVNVCTMNTYTCHFPLYYKQIPLPLTREAPPSGFLSCPSRGYTHPEQGPASLLRAQHRACGHPPNSGSCHPRGLLSIPGARPRARASPAASPVRAPVTCSALTHEGLHKCLPAQLHGFYQVLMLLALLFSSKGLLT